MSRRKNGAEPEPQTPALTPGFKIPERTVLMVFEDEEMKGCEVRCRVDMPLKSYFDFSDLQDNPDAKDVRTLYRDFADQLLSSWNFIKEDGTPIPANADGFLELPPWVALAIMRKWAEVATGVSAPLGQPSPAGSTSEAASRRRAK